MNELEKIKNDKVKQSNFVSKAVLNKVYDDDLADFDWRLIELRKFSDSILNYIDNIDWIIRFMNTIPVDKW